MSPLPWHRAPLERLLASRGRLPHALLVHGRSGIGKLEFARALAAAVLCESPGSLIACGTCAACHWFSQGNHPDFREIFPEALAEEQDESTADEGARDEEQRSSLVIRIEQIRAMADFMALTTHRAGLRVLVIRPADTLHPAAANALLKTLEEPPGATLIVLVSAQPMRLPATLRSRCQSLALAAPARESALAWLHAEGVEGATTLLDCAGGAPLLARDLANPEEMQLRQRVIGELARPGSAVTLGFTAGLDRDDLAHTLFWMQTWVHDLIQWRLAGEIRFHVASAAALRACASRASVEALFDLDRELTESRRLASHPLNPRLLAEHLVMAYNRATTGAGR